MSEDPTQSPIEIRPEIKSLRGLYETLLGFGGMPSDESWYPRDPSSHHYWWGHAKAPMRASVVQTFQNDSAMVARWDRIVGPCKDDGISIVHAVAEFCGIQATYTPNEWAWAAAIAKILGGQQPNDDEEIEAMTAHLSPHSHALIQGFVNSLPPREDAQN
jgi:hypothetical protein